MCLHTVCAALMQVCLAFVCMKGAERTEEEKVMMTGGKQREQ